LIGCGNIGALRADALRQLPASRLVAVSDVDRGRAAGIASAAGAEVADGWEALVERSEVDAVIVSTPPSSHSEICLRALRSGRHVLCEKPLARSAEECRPLVQTAQERGLLLATGFNFRFFPSIRKARVLLDSGVIGELDHVRAYAGYSASDHSPPWVHERAVVGGGALRDNGIHLLDLTRYFIGEVSEVSGLASGRVWRFEGCEDNGFALLRSEKGCIASLHASWTEWLGYRFRVELYGTRGCILASCFPMRVRALWFDRPGGRVRRTVDRFLGVQLLERLRSYRWVVVRSFVDELTAFAATVRGQATPLATGYDGLRAIEIAESIEPDHGDAA
jgi:predicted dehydrogenase